MARQRTGPPQPDPAPTGGGSTDPRLAAAMEILGRHIAVATGAISRQQASVLGRRDATDPTARLTGLFGGIMGTLVGRITAVLAPLAVVASMIGSPTSGFGVFLSAMKLLGGTLGSLLLPGFLVLSALIYAVSGYIASNLLPVLKDWYQAVVDGAITGVQLFEAAVVYASQKVREFAEWLRNFNEGMKGDVREEARRLGGPEDDRNVFDRVWRRFMQGWQSRMDRGQHPGGAPVKEDEFDRILRGIRDRDNGGQPFQLGGMFGGMNAPRQAPGITDRFMDGLRKSIQEFKFQNAPQARYTTGTDLYKEAQLAAVNVSPFEKTAMDFMGKVLQILGGIEANLPKPALVD